MFRLNDTIIQCIDSIDKFNIYLGDIETLIKMQIEDFNLKEFQSVRNRLKTNDEHFPINWTFAYLNYSLLIFSKDYISIDSPINKILRSNSEYWVSLKSLDLAIDKIQQTGQVEFDTQKFRAACIVQLIINFLKNIYMDTFNNANVTLKKGTKRIQNLRSKTPNTGEIQLINSINEFLSGKYPEMGVTNTLQPYNVDSILRKIILSNSSPKFNIAAFFEFVEHTNFQQQMCAIRLKENAIKQQVHLSSVDLIKIIRPTFIMDLETWKNQDEIIYSTPTDYYKRYAKKRILDTRIFE
jgi:hypothetical protein